VNDSVGWSCSPCQWSLGHLTEHLHTAAAPVALATTLPGLRVSAVAELLALVGVLVVMPMVEARSCSGAKESQSFARS